MKHFLILTQMLLFGCLFVANPVAAQQDRTLEADLLQLKRQLRQVQLRFPELDGQVLEVGTFVESDSYFQSNFDALSLLGPRPIYRIEVNPRIFALDCPPAAIEAVLAHELAHTLDYVRGGLAGILGIGWQLLVGPAPYERRTDLQAIFRGFGPGLRQYRLWLYAQLSPEQLLRKRPSRPASNSRPAG
ncbi:MAG: hypothetical protein CVV27_08670 [Candidatus Melainabacteria bacterium HGW-Melainabacteria-1]|nr:MAG: hypothetical protein CVV27_08670 [Candidatus Melainabacteria bacterium HGW-Melainabacteria-1]